MGKGNTTASGASQVLLSSGGISGFGGFWYVPELDLKQPDQEAKRYCRCGENVNDWTNDWEYFLPAVITAAGTVVKAD